MRISHRISASHSRAGIGWLLLIQLLCGSWRGFAQTYLFQQNSQPQGIIAAQSTYVTAGTTVQTVIAPATSSSYGFAYWLTNGVRAAAQSGQSLTVVSLTINSDTTGTAVYVPLSQSTNGDIIPDYQKLFYFGNSATVDSSDTDGDGFTLLQELALGFDPTIPDFTVNGGAILRLSDAATYVAGPLRYYYQIQSQPQGIFTSFNGYALAGTTLQTPDISYGQTSGYYFVGWQVNGVPQVGVTGAALNELTLNMTNNLTATAIFIAAGQSYGGLSAWYSLFWFGNTNQTTNSDPTGDGFSINDDILRGYSPVISNITVNGGAILRLSDAATYVAGPLRYYYQIQSQPQGIFTTLNGYVLAGSTLQTPDIAYGQTSGYYFVGWQVNGVPQIGVTGTALNELTLNLTNNQTATAIFIAAGQSHGGLPDWYSLYWFGNTDQTTNSDPTGDGFTINDDILQPVAPTMAADAMAQQLAHPASDQIQGKRLIAGADDIFPQLFLEAQRFMTASEDGTSDYNVVDVIREAGATIIAAAQSTTSFIPPLGNDKSKVLTLNLRNRMIFRAADEQDAVQSADFLGKKRVVKRSWGHSAGKSNVNYNETEEHKIKPHKLRTLQDHQCVLVHCERGFRRVTLPPLEPNGAISGWFPRWKKLF